ncbi:MAG: HIT domain-containing protein [Tepidisphaeraceae bacterium]
MPLASLQAPWRMEYIRSLEQAGDPVSKTGCFLCDAVLTAGDAQERHRRHVLWTSEHCVVLMNKYPYTSGHLLVAPRDHLQDLEAMSDAQLLDLQTQTVRAVRVLRHVMNPQAFNIGINLGRAAGAGLPGHLHQHIVSRWAGDTNFLSVVGEVRVIPHAMDQLWHELVAAMDELKIPIA